MIPLIIIIYQNSTQNSAPLILTSVSHKHNRVSTFANWTQGMVGNSFVVVQNVRTVNHPTC